MSRSIKKGPFIDAKLWQKVTAAKAGQLTGVIKTWSRPSVVFPEMVGLTIGVHNGKLHLPVKITEEMVGHRLGEFSPTRIFRKHGGKKAKEAEKSAAQAAPPNK